MITYITAFIFYTMAMIGVLLIGFVVYKKTIQQGKSMNKNMIKVIDSVAIAPKKILYVIKIKNEKFLIAGDAQTTTFLSKLNDSDFQRRDFEKEKDYRNEKEEKTQQKIKEEYQEKNNNIQNQFLKLYSAPDKTNAQSSERKEMIKKLIKDLNEGTATLQGSNY